MTAMPRRSFVAPAGSGRGAASGTAPATALARRSWRWALAGSVLGTGLALLSQAPAAWVATAVADASGGRVQLVEPRGTVWRGEARVVLTGGPGTRTAAALPDALQWTLRLRASALVLTLMQPCCLPDPLVLRLRPAVGGYVLHLAPPTGTSARATLPASWLTGLGAPWNTLQLRGTLRVESPGLQLEHRAGRLAFSGRADLRMDALSSRLTTLDTLGDYRLAIEGQAQAAGSARLELQTLRGPLMLSGSGQLGGAGPLRFRGEARASPGHDAALDNVLNIMGRRQGPVSVLSIG